MRYPDKRIHSVAEFLEELKPRSRLANSKKIRDTKKIYLDTFFKENKSKAASVFSNDVKCVKTVLNKMRSTFLVSDKLLRSSGMVALYFLLFKKSLNQVWAKKISRSKLEEFEVVRQLNRVKAEKNITKADYDLLEFDRLTQTPNDAYAIEFRLDLLEKFVRK